VQEAKMIGKNLFRFIMSLGLALLILISGTQVLAGSDRVTRGDVEGAFRSWNGGLRALRFISVVVAAAPTDGFQRGAIHPLLSDGKHYCSKDWHVVVAGWITGGDQSFTYRDAVANLSGIENAFILDGVTLSITQTSIVRRVAAGAFEEEYGYIVGSILSPSDLSVGEHTLTWLASFDGGPLEELTTITFYVDAAGTSACVR